MGISPGQTQRNINSRKDLETLKSPHILLPICSLWINMGTLVSISILLENHMVMISFIPKVNTNYLFAHTILTWRT